MSYLVLARKYRPRTFSELVGQAPVVQALGNALAQQRLHHAYLFTGTRGVGKTTISRILAKSINCTGADGQGGITAEPCGQCPACTEIDAGRFVDYTELDAASNRGVEEVQQLLEQAVYKPVQGRFKVFMIDEVHMLSGHAFNAMLKTLEEPPDYLKFVLATTDPQKVPATVLSRCLQFNLRPMAPETVQAHLKNVLEQEGIACEDGALRLLSRAARGSMRDALSLTDQAIAFGGGQVQEAQVRQMLGSVDSSSAHALIEALAAGDGQRVVELCDALRAAGQSAANTLESMAGALHSMAVRQAAPALPAAGDDPDAAEIAHLAALMPADETQLLYSLCIHGRAELGLAPDEYAGLVMTLLRLLPFKAQRPAHADSAPNNAPNSTPSAPAEKKTLTPPPEPRPAPTPAPAPVAAPVAPPPKPAPQPAEAAPPPPPPPAPAAPAAALPPAPDGNDARALADFWCQLTSQITDALPAFARVLPQQSQLVAQGDARWTLHCESATLVNNASAREHLQQALAAAGHNVQLEVRQGAAPDTPEQRRQASEQQLRQQARELLLGDPLVQHITREYGASLVEKSLRAKRL